ncbi:hypothetical protein [Gluconobacter kondonii]|uniref:hypothetical protein n=1 Tax=Gluconobacter kondonii TaxID=941463 RepID=UPI001B8B5374|nr:hypothetical protein [Gluconobacter kondonii]MBS1053506.1 hypothetical protein [Gluconobacter kondonii]
MAILSVSQGDAVNHYFSWNQRAGACTGSSSPYSTKSAQASRMANANAKTNTETRPEKCAANLSSPLILSVAHLHPSWEDGENIHDLSFLAGIYLISRV